MTCALSFMRRSVPRIGVCLFLAVVFTVLGSWLPAGIIWVGNPTSVHPSGGRFHWRVSEVGPAMAKIMRTSTAGSDVLHVLVAIPNDGGKASLPTGDEKDLAGVLTPWMCRYAWPRLRARFAVPGMASGLVWIESRGWPARACWCEYDLSGPGTISTAGAIVLRGTHRTLTAGEPRTLPYRPIWSGLAINMGFWTAVAASLVFAPTLIRRAYRRRTSACVTCGYDLTGLAPVAPCPECGAARLAPPVP